MPKKTEIRESKRELDMQALIKKYGNDKAPDFEPTIKGMLSRPNPNAPVKIPKR